MTMQFSRGQQVLPLASSVDFLFSYLTTTAFSGNVGMRLLIAFSKGVALKLSCVWRLSRKSSWFIIELPTQDLEADQRWHHVKGTDLSC